MLKEAQDGKGMAVLYEKSISFVTHSQGKACSSDLNTPVLPH